MGWLAHRGLRHLGVRPARRLLRRACLSTCIGLFLFTRILIPDVMLTATIALAMWAFLRVLDEEEPHPRLWAFALAASLGVGLLLKSAVGVVFPAAAALLYLLLHAAVVCRAKYGSGCAPGAGSRLSCDCRAVARAGDAAQSAVFRLHLAQRARANTTAFSGFTSSTSRCCAS